MRYGRAATLHRGGRNVSLPFTPEQFLQRVRGIQPSLVARRDRVVARDLGYSSPRGESQPTVPRADVSACGALGVERCRVSRVPVRPDQSSRVDLRRDVCASGGILCVGWRSHQASVLLIRRCDGARWCEPCRLCSRVPVLDDGIRSSISGSADVRCACPTVILTIGLLLTVRGGIPPILTIVPVLWGFIGGSAAVLLDVRADYVLVGAGILMALAVKTRRRTPAATPSDATRPQGERRAPLR